MNEKGRTGLQKNTGMTDIKLNKNDVKYKNKIKWQIDQNNGDKNSGNKKICVMKNLGVSPNLT